jgi:hypothetical protein
MSLLIQALLVLIKKSMIDKRFKLYYICTNPNSFLLK